MTMLKEEVLRKAAGIRLAVFDVDGVLTGGEIFIGPYGEEFKRFHAQDGLGIALLQRSGIEVGIISSRQSEAVAHRMESLGVRHVIQGRHDKLQALRELLDSTGIAPEETAFVGDDLIDLPALRHAGLAIAVANAVPVVRENAHWTTAARGGEGAVREICELLLRAKGLFEDHINHYLHGE